MAKCGEFAVFTCKMMNMDYSDRGVRLRRNASLDWSISLEMESDSLKVDDNSSLIRTHLFSLLQWQLILPPSLEVIESHEQLRISILVFTADQKVFSWGPPQTSSLQRMKKSEAAERGQVILRWGRNLGQWSMLQQSLCKNISINTKKIENCLLGWVPLSCQ